MHPGCRLSRGPHSRTYQDSPRPPSVFWLPKVLYTLPWSPLKVLFLKGWLEGLAAGSRLPPGDLEVKKKGPRFGSPYNKDHGIGEYVGVPC